MEETLRALDDLVRQGKYVISMLQSTRPGQMVEAEWIARERGLHRFISAQDEYSLLRLTRCGKRKKYRRRKPTEWACFHTSRCCERDAHRQI